MKNLFVSRSCVLATIAFIATATTAFAGPGSPAPAGGSIKFAPTTNTLVAGPGSPAPAGGSIKFAQTTLNSLS